MLKKTLKSSFVGIAVAVIIFSLVGVIIDLSNGGSYTLNNHMYSKMFLGAVIIGLGFGMPAAIYGNERIPYPLQIVFHMGIGCAVMLITGFTIGWFPAEAGAFPVVLSVVGEIAVAFIIWCCFTLHYKKEAEKINRRLSSTK